MEIRNHCSVCPFLALWLTSYLYSFTLELMLSLPIPYSSHYYFLHFHYCTAHYFIAALLTLPSYIVRFLLCFFPYFCITLCNSTRFVSCGKSENVSGHTFYFTSFFFTCLIPFSLSCSIPCQSLVSIAYVWNILENNKM